jgi:hypothetical protein
LFRNADVSSVSEKWYDGVYDFFEERELLNLYAFTKEKMEREITRFEVAEALVYCFPLAKEAYLKNERYQKRLFSDTIGMREEMLAVMMTESGIFSGYPDSTIRWSEGLTRAEMVCIFANVLENKEKLEKFRFKREEPIYEDNYAISTDLGVDFELQPYQYSRDERIVITKLKSVELIDCVENVPEKYKYILTKLDTDLPAYKAKKKNVEENKLIIVEFETINTSDKYSLATGSKYLYLKFPEREDIELIERFDTDDFSYSSYFVVVWKEGGYTRLKLKNNKLYPYEIDVKDQHNRNWKIKQGWADC